MSYFALFVIYSRIKKCSKGGNSFVDGSFKLWNNISKFEKHVACKSHCLAQQKYVLFKKIKNINSQQISKAKHKTEAYV
jgi:hypothetical protein